MKKAAARRLPFHVSVTLPVALAVAAVIALAGWLVVWSADASDERALGRQQQLVRHILEKEKQYLTNGQVDISPNDEAVGALGHPLDMDYVDEVLGGDFFDSYSTHRIYVLDPDLRPVYAMRNGGRTDPASFSADEAVVKSLAAQLQTPAALSQIDAFENGRADVPTLADFVLIEGRAALISLTPILGESDEVVVPPGKAFIHVAIRFLDEGLAGELSDAYFVEAPHFAGTPDVAWPAVSLPVLNNEGITVAWFSWVPDRPGLRLLSESGPWLLAALGGGLLVVTLLLIRVSRMSSALEAARAAADYRAMHDPLTGLANRAAFDAELERARAELSRESRPVALLALDLDRFKQVNDTLGHEAGDSLLRQVADRIRPLLRGTDLVARLGGDEFAIVMHGIHSAADGTTLAARLVATVAEPYRLGMEEARIGVSIGVALATSPGELRDLPSRADMALYAAKDAGRNQFRLYGAEASNVVGLARPGARGAA